MTSKKLSIIYWLITGLMAAFMLMASIPDVLMVSGAATFIKHLGYPVYILPFLGVAKVLAVLVIVVPGCSDATSKGASHHLCAFET